MASLKIIDLVAKSDSKKDRMAFHRDLASVEYFYRQTHGIIIKHTRLSSFSLVEAFDRPITPFDLYTREHMDHPIIILWKRKRFDMYPTPNPRYTRNFHDLHDHMWGADLKYHFVCGPFLVGTSNLDIAISWSYRARYHEEMPDLTWTQPFIRYFSAKDKITAKRDGEYAKIISDPDKSQEIKACWKPFDRYTGEEYINKKLYSIFKQEYEELMTKRAKVDHMRKMASTKLATAYIDPLRCAKQFILTEKNEITPKDWLERGVVYSIATQFPKISVLKSDKTFRVVAAPDPTQEAWMRREYRHSSPTLLDGFIETPKRIDRTMRYSYDIKSCDAVVGPYFRKFLRENIPDKEDLHMPMVLDKNGTPYRTRALPTGILITSLITNIFAKSVARYYSLVNYQFNGDTIITDRSITDDLNILRRNEDYTINGFGYKTELRYINTHKLKETPLIRRGKANGKMRYLLKYLGAAINNANLEGFPIPPDVVVDGVTYNKDTPIKKILKLFEKQSVELSPWIWYSQMEQQQEEPSYNRSNCESTAMTVRDKREKRCILSHLVFDV